MTRCAGKRSEEGPCPVRANARASAGNVAASMRVDLHCDFRWIRQPSRSMVSSGRSMSQFHPIARPYSRQFAPAADHDSEYGTLPKSNKEARKAGGNLATSRKE